MKENKNSYHNLITKFLAGEADERETKMLKNWLEEDASNRVVFDSENELWQESGIRTKIEIYKTDEAWKNLSSVLGLGLKKKSNIKFLSMPVFRLLVAAATVAVLVALTGMTLWLAEKRTVTCLEAVSSTIETREGEKARVVLSDSTEIILNSGSSIHYDGSYNKESRNVSFYGEGYFDVMTNPEKPFIVNLDRIKVSATGTKFNIFSFGNEDRIETTLEEGHISIEIDGRDRIELEQGQQAVFFRKTGKVILQDVASDTYTSWKENKLRFSDTPLEEVLRRIGRKYNVVFEITNNEILDLKYTATFIDESIEDVMKLLKDITPITYSISYRTAITDKKYLKPKITVGKRKNALL